MGLWHENDIFFMLYQHNDRTGRKNFQYDNVVYIELNISLFLNWKNTTRQLKNEPSKLRRKLNKYDGRNQNSKNVNGWAVLKDGILETAEDYFSEVSEV